VRRGPIDLSAPPAILVTSHPGDPSVADLERDAAAGLRPRRDYVELARRTAGVVIDAEHMAHRAAPAARRVARRAGLPAGQVAEAFLRRRSYGGVLAWADRLGVPFALLCKLARSRRDTVLVSVLLSNPKKAIPMRAARLHTHFGAIVAKGTQLEIAATRLGVPREKLHRGEQTVDERFWSARGDALDGGPVVAVGWEQRDYPTLLRAVDGLDVGLEVAVGSIAAPEHGGIRVSPLGDVPGNVRVRANLTPVQLRDLYGRARMVVVPLHDVEFDAGVTAITEAMAMGKPVIVSRTRGQRDILADGEQGLYVPPAQPRAMRAAIEGLAADPPRAAAMGRAGRALIERRHRLDLFIAQLAELLDGARLYRSGGLRGRSGSDAGRP
jgi:hypothetical protein